MSEPTPPPVAEPEAWPEVPLSTWRAAVEASLKGADFERRLVRHTEDGLRIEPLYTAADLTNFPATGAPGVFPYTRGAQAVAGWQARVRLDEPGPVAANRALHTDLARGADAVTLVVGSPCRAGIAIHRAPELAHVLADVDLARTPLGLDAGALGVATAALVLAQAKGQPLAVGGDLGLDPLGTLAAEGQAGGNLADAWARAAAVACWLEEAGHRGVRAFNLDAGVFQRAGATEVDALALLLANGVEALRALTAAGLAVRQAAVRIGFTLELDAGFFGGIAALRAFRQLWSKVLAAALHSEIGQHASQGSIPTAHLVARPAARMFTQRDPWVNLLRNTAACFAAAVGGAQVICPMPFDAALGRSDDMARRISRNTLTILANEAYLGAVVDPAGGAWFLESRTLNLAFAAWGVFQQIEALGGLGEALTSGWVGARLEASAVARQQKLAHRTRPVLGVSTFANLDEAPVVREPAVAVAPDAHGSPPAADAPLAAVRAAKTPRAAFEQAIVAAAAGATLGDLAEALRAKDTGRGAQGEVWFTPLPVHADAADFEALRDASDAWLATQGLRPQVLLVTLGTLAEHTARVGFATQLLAAGGIAAVEIEAPADPDAPVETLAAAWAEALRDRGITHACICGSDARYAALAVPLARGLLNGGAKGLWLAGRPGEGWAEAPVDAFVSLGGDAVAALRALQVSMGVVAEDTEAGARAGARATVGEGAR